MELVERGEGGVDEGSPRGQDCVLSEGRLFNAHRRISVSAKPTYDVMWGKRSRKGQSVIFPLYYAFKYVL